MSTKWQRGFAIQIQTMAGDLITITSPLTLEFVINRQMLGSCNTGSFKILNLAPETRAKIYHDAFNGLYRTLQVQAGHSGSLKTIFKGNVLSAYSGRPEGSPNVITDIQGQDGGWSMQHCIAAPSIGAGATEKDALSDLCGALRDNDPNKDGHVDIGKISPVYFNKIIPKGLSFSPESRVVDHIRTMTQGNFFIDLERIFCMQSGVEDIGGIGPQITSEMILGSPRRTGSYISCDLLFEPSLKVGQKVILNSYVNPQFNGEHMVAGFRHYGTISGAVGGKLKTVVDLWLGNDLMNKVQSVAGGAGVLA